MIMIMIMMILTMMPTPRLTKVLMTLSSPVSGMTTRQLYSPSMASVMLRMTRLPVSRSRMMSPPPRTVWPARAHSPPWTQGSASSDPAFTLCSSSSRGTVTTETRMD